MIYLKVFICDILLLKPESSIHVFSELHV